MLKKHKIKPKLFIMLSFKEFLKDSAFDEERYYFLDRLQAQTYDNAYYVVTIFNEKYVEQCIRPRLKNPERWIFKYNTLKHEEHKYSVNDMLLNTVNEAIKHKHAMVVSFNTDTFLSKRCFEIIANHYEKNVSCAVPMQPYYTSMNDLINKKNYTYSDGINGLIELHFFDVNIFRNTNAMDDIIRFRVDGWGVHEFLFKTIFELYASKMLNLYYIDMFGKLENEQLSGAHIQKNCFPQYKNLNLITCYDNIYGLYNEIDYLPLIFAYKDLSLFYKVKLLILNKKIILRYMRNNGVIKIFNHICLYLSGKNKNHRQ